MKKGVLFIIIIIVIIFVVIEFILPSKNSNISIDQKVQNIMAKKEPLTIVELKILLANTSIPSLKIGAKNYSVNNNKVFDTGSKEITGDEERQVLQLALIYLQTKEDPLFTSPDFDSEKFLLSVSILEQEQIQLLEPQKRQMPIFPIPFLKIIPDVLEKEEAFLTDPSLESAQKLLDSYTLTASAYKKEIQDFTKFIGSKKSSIDVHDVIQMKVATNNNIMFADLDKIVGNGQILENETQNRQDCLQKGQSCKRQIFFFASPDIKEIKSEKVNLLPLDILFPTNTPKVDELRGPYIIHSPCWGWGKDFSFPPVPIYIRDTTTRIIEKSSGQPFDIISLKVGNQNFYRRITNSDDFDRGLSKLGLTRVALSETAGYLCRNLEYQTEVSTLDSFIAGYKNKPLFSQLKSEDLDSQDLKFKEKAQKFESDFLKLTSSSDDDFAILANIYAYAYKSLLLKNVNPQTANEALKRYLIINRKLSNFPKILNRAANEFAYLIQIQALQPNVYDHETVFYNYVYPFKSYWYLLYIPFSPSFWRSSEHPEYLKKVVVDDKTPLDKKWFISYKEALTLFKPEEIKKFHTTSNEYQQKTLHKVILK